MTSEELVAEMLRMSGELDRALGYAKTAAREHAEADNEYRMARAKSLLNAEGTVAEKEARADLDTGTERQRARLAESMNKVAVEAVRSRRAQLSAIQTVANTLRAEADLLRYDQQSSA